MTNCKDSLALLLDYADGALKEDLRVRLEAHFDGCQPCVEFLKSYVATPQLCRKALVARMPKDFAEKLNEFLRQVALDGAHEEQG